MKIEAKNISFSIGEKEIISHIDLKAESGEFIGIVGPNGSGKSTMLKNLYRYYQPNSGLITVNEKDIKRHSAKETAKHLAVVSQDSPVNFEFSVREIVLMGRSPHKNLLETDNLQDEKIADEALEKVGLLEYGGRSVTTLSGGEKQRVMLARALAQKAKILILDEPTNHLDVYYQLQFMDLIDSLEITVVGALHDLNIAAKYCDKIYVIKDGEIKVSGTPEEVFTVVHLKEIFQIHTDISRHPINNNLNITYLSRVHGA